MKKKNEAVHRTRPFYFIISSLFHFLKPFRQPFHFSFLHMIEPLRVAVFLHGLLIIVLHSLSRLFMKQMKLLFFFFRHPLFRFM